MTTDGLKKAFKSAYLHAYSRRLPDPDDFAQEYCIACWRRGYRASVRRFFVDYLRKNYGDWRNPKGRILAKIRASTGSGYRHITRRHISWSMAWAAYWKGVRLRRPRKLV